MDGKDVHRKRIRVRSKGEMESKGKWCGIGEGRNCERGGQLRSLSLLLLPRT